MVKRKRNVAFILMLIFYMENLMGLPNHRNEAINRFQSALEIKPTDEFAQYNLAKRIILMVIMKAKNIPVSNQYYVVELTAYTDAKLGEYEKLFQLLSSYYIGAKRLFI